MKTERVPIRIAFASVSCPPCQRTIASVTDESMVTVEIKSADTWASLTEVFFISLVSALKSVFIFSSIPRTLMDLAPVIPSL